MQYYILKNSNEKKVIGSQYPQIQEAGGAIRRNASDSIYRVPSGSFPDFTPNLNYLILHPKAKLTDVLSAAHISNGFIVNQKVKDIFDEFNLIDHEYYPALISHNGTLYNNYFWFCPIGDLINLIDFNKTEFYKTNFFGQRLTTKKNSFSNFREFNEYKKTLSRKEKIASETIYFNSEILDFSLFKITSINHKIFISKDLYASLHSNKIEGFDFLDSKFIQSD